MSENGESGGVRAERVDEEACVVSWRIEIDDDGDEPDELIDAVPLGEPSSAPEGVPLSA